VHITLIGMSNIGKSYWAKRLHEAGYEWVDCDLMVENMLKEQLKEFNYQGIEGVAEWMGHPFDPQYPQTSKLYIDCEKAVMREVLDKLRKAPAGSKPCVIDTTGSVIYTGDEITEELGELSRIVYLEASREHVAELFSRYMIYPKPLIWDNIHAPREGETPQQAMMRAYPLLLESRARRYANMAHETIAFERHRKSKDLLAEFAQSP
jgi:shikimate kinase